MSSFQVGKTLLVANVIHSPIGVASQAPVFASNDTVPFRFTPNMQRFLGPILIEGLLTTGILAIARCLTEPDVRLGFLAYTHFEISDILI